MKIIVNRFVGLGLLLALGVSACSNLEPTAAGMAAKFTCSAVHVSGREREAVVAKDVMVVPMTDRLVDAGSVQPLGEAGRLGIRAGEGEALREAEYRDGLGCVLLAGDKGPSAAGVQAPQTSQDWPVAPKNAYFEAVLGREFAGSGGSPDTGARGVVVIQDGRLVAERYAEADGFTKDTPQLGWSMAKSILSLLVGMRVGDCALDANNCLLDLNDANLFPEWRNDRRAEIRVEDLLFMRDGLDTTENYTPFGVLGSPSVPEMLWMMPDTSLVARQAPAAEPAGKRWAYRSATTNVLSRVLRNSFDDDQAYWRYPRERLFDPIGAHGAVFEVDASGNFVGSSYVYASPRDWARFGQLMLQKGVWDGQQILPPWWVAYATSLPGRYIKEGPTSYGAQIWLTATTNPWPAFQCDLPPDAYFFSGHWGQKVGVFPSQNMVVARLGWTIDGASWDECRFLKDMVRAAEKRDTCPGHGGSI